MQCERTGLISSAFAGLAACIGHPLGGDALGGGAGRAACIGHPLGGLEAAICATALSCQRGSVGLVLPLAFVRPT